MCILIRHLAAIFLTAFLVGCGGGDSTSSHLRCGNVDCKTLNDPVSTIFFPADNNLRVTVDDLGPHSFDGKANTINTNILYATVTVCAFGGVPGNTSECTEIDHVLVDSGSVGLRVLASKVSQLGLTPIPLASGNAWECFPFVIGGLWGPNVAADVWLGKQKAEALSIQLIDDQRALAPSEDCKTITNTTLVNSNILASAGQLRANGILGIGSTRLDCGRDCAAGQYHVQSSDPPGSSVLYYSCPQIVSSPMQCSLAPMDAALQVFNPVAKLPDGFNNGVVLKMPAIPDTQPGAATASGELILGIDTNNLPPNATKVFLGVTDTDSYLAVKTLFNRNTYANSYLDTGTNGMFFYDGFIKPCASDSQAYFWYCPDATMKDLKATLSDGDPSLRSGVEVTFQVANFSVLNFTDNTAFSGAAGAVNQSGVGNTYVPDTKTFAWGMPFFYGKSVYLSIWQQPGSEAGPWYAWTVP